MGLGPGWERDTEEGEKKRIQGWEEECGGGKGGIPAGSSGSSSEIPKRDPLRRSRLLHPV